MDMNTLKLSSIVVALVALYGCANTPEQRIAPSPEFTPVFPVVDTRTQSLSGSLFVDSRNDNYFGRQRDYKVGDVVTVILKEEAQSSRTQNNTTKRESTNDALATLTSGLASTLKNSSMGLGTAVGNIKASGATIGNTGTGDAGQKASLTGSIAVTVIEVLPNGNLVIRGEKILTLSEGSEVIQVSGIVRTEDVAPDGTVQSRRLANAQISYRGSGDLTNAVRPGWGTSALQKYWPF